MKRTSLLSMILVHAYLTLAHDLDTHVWSPEEQTIEFGIVRLQISLQLERNPRAKDIDELRLGNRVPFEAPDISQEGLVAVDYVSTDPGKSSFQIFYVKDDNDEFRFHSFRGIVHGHDNSHYVTLKADSDDVMVTNLDRYASGVEYLRHDFVIVVVKAGFISRWEEDYGMKFTSFQVKAYFSFILNTLQAKYELSERKMRLHIYFSSPYDMVERRMIIDDNQNTFTLSQDALSNAPRQKSTALATTQPIAVFSGIVCQLSLTTQANRCVSQNVDANSYAVSKSEVWMEAAGAVERPLALAKGERATVKNPGPIIRAIEVTDNPFINGLIITTVGSILSCVVILLLGKPKRKPKRKRNHIPDITLLRASGMEPIRADEIVGAFIGPMGPPLVSDLPAIVPMKGKKNRHSKKDDCSRPSRSQKSTKIDDQLMILTDSPTMDMGMELGPPTIENVLQIHYLGEPSKMDDLMKEHALLAMDSPLTFGHP